MESRANSELARIRRALTGPSKPDLKVIQGDVQRFEDRTPPKAWVKPNTTGREYITLRYRSLRKGTMFLPIEKTGKAFYYRDSKGKLVKERRYAIGNELFIKDEPYRAYSAHNGRDGIFSANDWCIVPKD